MKSSEESFMNLLSKMLRCPNCAERLQLASEAYKCSGGCGLSYPIVRGVPVLINPYSDSLFKSAASAKPVEFFTLNPVRRVLRKLTPELGLHMTTGAIDELKSMLLVRKQLNVLVVGGGEVGADLGSILSSIKANIFETDVVFGIRTKLIMDVHNIPFGDEQFDCCIIQAVLEHVCDPHLAVKEIHRVLKNDGLVYAETPFMQQVHMGRFDFTRFTLLGHRRLFRAFETIRDGSVSNAGSVLAWSIEHLALSIIPIWVPSIAIRFVVRFTVWPLKYLDYLMANNPRALDAAGGFFFLGKKCSQMLSDAELVNLYRGGETRF